MEKITQIILCILGLRSVWVAPQGPEGHPLKHYFLRNLVIHTHGLILLKVLSSFSFSPFHAFSVTYNIVPQVHRGYSIWGGRDLHSYVNPYEQHSQNGVGRTG